MSKKLTIISLVLLPVLANATGSETSQASLDLSAQGMGQIIGGSSQIIASGSQLVVASVQTVGEFVDITLKAIGQSATTTIRVTRNGSGYALVGVGQVVNVIATGSGNLLIHSGKIIGYLPNQLGKSLLYSNKVNSNNYKQVV